jgi:hypothetical protein
VLSVSAEQAQETVPRRAASAITEAEVARAQDFLSIELGLMWTELSDQVRVTRGKYPAEFETARLGARFVCFDNRLAHRTSVNLNGNPLQSRTNRLVYFGSRSSVGLVGFPPPDR